MPGTDALLGEATGAAIRYRFDGYVLDTGALELRDPEGRAIELAPTAFDLMLHLIRCRARVVSREELVRELWPDVVVNDNALAQCVWAARRAIGDAGREQRLIKNVRGRGYRFIGVATQEEAAAPARTSRPPPGGAARSLLGRAAELEWLGAALADAAEGKGRICLLGGPAGIGKTRIAREASALATESGFVVLEGRGDDDEGMPPFWPWKQILRALVGLSDATSLGVLVGADAADLAKLVPDLRHRLPDLGVAPPREADDDRYYLFQAVSDFLRRASADRPLFVVVDDLHWVDPSSLRLLKFLAPVLGSMRVAMLATFRAEDMDAGRAKIVAGIARQPAAEQRDLSGLSNDAISELLIQLGHGAHGPIVEHVARVTSGNPLFVMQLAPLLVAGPADATELREMELPSAIRDALGRRIERLSEGPRTLLVAASVLGQTFRLSDLRQATGHGSDEVLRLLSELVSQRILSRSGGDGVYAFTHPLVRETVYRAIPEGDRVRLHRQVAEAIERAYAHFPLARLDELAHHYAAAAPAGVAGRAVHYARLAAEKAMAATAFEEAARHYRRALSVLDAEGTRDEPERCQLLLGLGHSLRGSGTDAKQVRAVFQEAADRARAIERPDLFADAALGFAGKSPLRLGRLTEMGLVDRVEVSLLTSAAELLGPEDSEKKTLVLGWLACSLYHSSETARRTRIADDAVAMARRLGPESVLAAALHSRQQLLRSPHVLDQRISDLVELAGITERTGDRDLQVDARVELAWAFVQAARIAEAEAEILAASRLAAELGQASSQRAVEQWNLVLSYVRENVDDVATRDLERLMSRRNAKAGQAYGLRLMMGRFMQHRAGETVHLSEQFVEDLPLPVSWRCGLCSTYAILGRTEESRELFEELAVTGFAGVPMTHDWLSSYMLLASACCLLGDVARAPILRDILRPFEGNIQVMGFGNFILGPVTLALSELHTLLRDFGEAERCSRIAIELGERLRSPSLAAWAKVNLAEAYAVRGGDGDAARARAVIAECSPDIARTGFVHLARRVQVIEALL